MRRVETENSLISRESQFRVPTTEKIYRKGKFWVLNETVTDGESEEKDGPSFMFR